MSLNEQLGCLQPLQDQSDRISLTVRVCRDGQREWLSADDKTALVFFEAGCWWSRKSAASERFQHNNELAALNTLLEAPLLALRQDTRGF